MVDYSRVVQVTSDGFVRLKKELEELVDVKRPEVIAQVAEARSHGDLRENAGYEAARLDQAMIEKRISDLEHMLRNAEVFDVDDADAVEGVVRLGSKVVVDFEGDEETYTVVGPIEAQPGRGMISTESPIGKALVGKRAGDRAEFTTPGGIARLEVKDVS